MMEEAAQALNRGDLVIYPRKFGKATIRRRAKLIASRRLLAEFMTHIREEMKLMVGQTPVSESQPVPPMKEYPNGTIEIRVLQRVSTQVTVPVPRWAAEEGLLAELMVGIDLACDHQRARAMSALLKWAERVRRKADSDAYLVGHWDGWGEACEVEDDAHGQDPGFANPVQDEWRRTGGADPKRFADVTKAVQSRP